MRQVPANSHASSADPSGAHYLIIGDGRLAEHLRTFLSLENLVYSQWARSSGRSLNPELESATHVLLCISDGALAQFVAENPAMLKRVCVHFSGSVVLPEIPSAHPLMTFAAGEKYSLDVYRSIPFVLETGRSSLAELMPGLSNASFAISPEQKPLYHALCAMAGNFTVLLWEKAFSAFGTLGLPREVLLPFLAQVSKNLISSREGVSVLTGPLVRGDDKTIAKHLAVLGDDPYADVYRAFVAAYSVSHAAGIAAGISATNSANQNSNLTFTGGAHERALGT